MTVTDLPPDVRVYSSLVPCITFFISALVDFPPPPTSWQANLAVDVVVTVSPLCSQTSSSVKSTGAAGKSAAIGPGDQVKKKEIEAGKAIQLTVSLHVCRQKKHHAITTETRVVKWMIEWLNRLLHCSKCLSETRSARVGFEDMGRLSSYLSR